MSSGDLTSRNASLLLVHNDLRDFERVRLVVLD